MVGLEDSPNDKIQFELEKVMESYLPECKLWLLLRDGIINYFNFLLTLSVFSAIFKGNIKLLNHQKKQIYICIYM